MGYRSTLVSEHYGGTLPSWFTEKYSSILSFNETLIASKRETKLYDKELFEDYQKALIEMDFFGNWTFRHGVAIVVMGEDQAITKVIIKRNSIQYISMEDGKIDDDQVSISEITEESGLRYSTIKYYTEIGILPCIHKGHNLMRKYQRKEALERLKEIAKLKQEGKKIKEIQEILK